MGAMADNEQTEILRGIWTEMKALNGRVDKTNTGLEAVRTEFSGALVDLRSEMNENIESLKRRMTDSEVRLATAVTQLASDVQSFGQQVKEWRKEHREDRNELRARVSRLEQLADTEKH
jgi:chromosome segregation ATPase